MTLFKHRRFAFALALAPLALGLAACSKGGEDGATKTGEPVAKVAEVGRERGLDIRCATLEEAAFPDGTFDVVFSNAVLEHVPSPGAVLRETWRVLRPGGVVYADTVNIGSYTWKWLGPRWKLIDPRAHLGLFTPATLRRHSERIEPDVFFWPLTASAEHEVT